MAKPITVARQDTFQAIQKAINDSGLPAFVLVDLLKPMVASLEVTAVRQYKEDLKAYQESEVDEHE